MQAQSGFQEYLLAPNEGPVQSLTSSATEDGGLIIATVIEGVIHVSRLDSLGSPQWSTSISTIFPPDFWEVWDVNEVDGGPGFYVLAQRTGHGPTNFVDPLVIVELDANHDVVFARRYWNSHGACEGWNAKAHRYPSGGFLLSIPTSSNFHCLYGLTAQGDTTFTNLYSRLPAGAGYLYGATSIQLNDGSVLLLNHASGNLQFMRVDTLGDFIWSRSYQSLLSEKPFDARQAPDDSIYVAGNQVDGLGVLPSYGFILKMGLDGHVGWRRRFEFSAGPDTTAGIISNMALLENGELLVHTTYYNNDLLIRMDPTGQILEVIDLDVAEDPWPGYFRHLEIQPVSDGEFYVVGSPEYYGAPYWDDSVMVARVSELGEIACNATPHFWYEEVVSDPMPEVANGAESWSQWFRMDTIQLMVASTTWSTAPYCIPTAIQEPTTKDALSIWPVPAASGSQAQVLLPWARWDQLHILDVRGVKVYGKDGNGSGPVVSMPLVGIPPGFYLVEVVGIDRQRLTARLVVE